MAINNIYETPKTFLTKTNHEYPPNNKIIFEEYFLNRFKEVNPDTKRTYLPILWTNFYISRGYATQSLEDLQNFLDNLPRDKKYFTIVQWDDGILDVPRPNDNGKALLNLDGLDLIRFSSGGIGDYEIPLINQPHTKTIKNRDIFASFLGSLAYNRANYGIRKQMVESLRNKNGYLIENSTGPGGFGRFKDIMERSIFSLCPRGYGKSSFRINEALNLGSIPVYLYDEPWIPFKDMVDFSEYGVLVPQSEIHRLDEILKSYAEEDIKKLQNKGQEVYNEYYTYESCFNKIIEKSNEL